MIKKSLGQNFLKSEKALNSIISAADLKSDDFVVEIGPGKGALTEKLLKENITVLAIEKDERMCDFLKDILTNLKLKGFTLNSIDTYPSHKFCSNSIFNVGFIDKNSEKIQVEITSRNKFEIMQRIMSLSPNCKILYPQEFKKELIENLTKMKEGYLEKR